LVIPSDMQMLGNMRTFLEAVCETCGLDASATYAVVLAAGEAVSNIICHGHRLRCELPISIQCRRCADCLELQILDEGEPFDLSAIQCQDPTELRVGGRGVFLIRQLMDEVSCERREPRGNVLRLVKRYSPTSER